MASRLIKVTATGDVIAGNSYLKSIILQGGTAATTLDVRDGAATTVLASLTAPINDTVIWATGAKEGVYFTSAVHATLAGAGGTASFEIEPE